MSHPLLQQISKAEPGRYLTEQEVYRIASEDEFMKPRLQAAKAAQEKEQVIVQAAIKATFKKFDFSVHDYYEGKCYRDVAMVYRYCVFSMLCNDTSLLENKLLYWMRTIIQAFEFPGRNDSIRLTYAGMRREAWNHLSQEHARLLDPYLELAENVLPATGERHNRE
ncbi:MAG: hypothetical protein RLY93_16230 [Sumerlaeia bacterium]